MPAVFFSARLAASRSSWPTLRSTLRMRSELALQRRRARRQGLRGGQPGAVSFIQFFGSALQVTPHFHSLVPDGVFVPGEGGVHFEGLAPPTQGEVERLLRVVRHRVWEEG